MVNLLQDFRYGFRILAKNPAFTLVVVLSMGLSIGANTTVFTWLENLVLNPTPAVLDSARIVAVNSANKDGVGDEAEPFSYLTYVDWRDQAQSFDGLLAHNIIRLNLRELGEAQGEPLWGELVSGNYFDVLGVSAVAGRTFSLDEERGAARVAVLNYRLWQTKFGGESAIAGKHILLNGVEFTIIGVTPPAFNGVLAAYTDDVWIPITTQPALGQGRNRIADRSDRWLQGSARLKPGVSLAQAEEEMKIVARQISESRGDVPTTSAVVRLMRERFSGVTFYPMFSSLLGITALVLLIACANVGNLLLARASSRRKEIGIRLALGASRGRVVRQLMVENLIAAIIGGLVGLLFAIWCKDSLGLFFPPTPQPRFFRFEINTRILLFAFFISLMTALLFGLIPALRSSRVDLVNVLKEEGRGASGPARSLLRSSLIVAQIALSLVSLMCAGLFLQSLRQARQIDVGFRDPSRVLLVTTDFNSAGLKRENALPAVDQLLERVRSLPGVTAASFSSMVPLGFGGHAFSETRIEGYIPAPDERIFVERVNVSDDYFETMGIHIVDGRGITSRDSSNAQRIVVVNEAFARRYYAGQDPIGKRIDQGEGWSVIVGVAKDIKSRDLEETPTPIAYSSLQQWYAWGLTLHVRSEANPKFLIEPVRGIFATVNGNLPVLDPRTLAEHMSASMFRQSFGASMLSLFAALALLIAAVGVYGVLTYIVSQRSREIAIRMALGATSGIVYGLVLKQVLHLVALGTGIGLILGFAARRFLQSQLLGVVGSDPLIFAGVIALLAAVALGACFVPARRAIKVDPMVLLRYE